jgi:acid phosphatase type 7
MPRTTLSGGPRGRAGALLVAALMAAALVGVLALSAGAATVLTFTPVADTYVSAAEPGPFGTSTQLRADDSPVVRAYLRFDPEGIPGPVTRASLRFWANAAHSKGVNVVAVASTTWAEGISFSAAPPLGSTVAASGPYAASTWVSVDVTSLVRGPGPVSLALTIDSSGATSVASRESGAHAPQLVIETGTSSSDIAAPSVPTNVRATAASSTQVALAWSASTDNVAVTAYEIRRNGSPVATVGGTSFSDAGLSPGTSYSYTVTALDAAGNRSAPSTAASATTPPASASDTTPPATPANVRATAASSSQMALSWSPSTDNVAVSGYEIRRNGTLVATVGAVTGFTDSGLAASTTYRYTVAALDAAGNRSPQSAEAQGTTAASSGGGSGDPVVAAAGDIACGTGYQGDYCMQMQTSDQILKMNPAAVLALGDIQYEGGAYSDYVNASSNPKIGYDKAWGRFKTKTYPAIGNHEYLTPLADNYFRYWSDFAARRGTWAKLGGDPVKGWYSFDVGAWHLVSFNSNCKRVDCTSGGEQYNWLKQDLAAHAARCTLAFAHHPFRNSFFETSLEPRWPDIFKLFYDTGVDLVVVGHAHNYERMAPIDPSASIDRARGVRQFVVGTGGRSPAGASATPKPYSEAHAGKTIGVLKLTLHAAGYDWSFNGVAATPMTDTGSATCH